MLTRKQIFSMTSLISGTSFLMNPYCTHLDFRSNSNSLPERNLQPLPQPSRCPCPRVPAGAATAPAPLAARAGGQRVLLMRWVSAFPLQECSECVCFAQSLAGLTVYNLFFTELSLFIKKKHQQCEVQIKQLT